MSEPAGRPSRPGLVGWPARLSGESADGWFRPDLLVLDAACGAWLAYAYAVFHGHEGAAPVRFAVMFGLLASLGWGLCGGHGRWRHWPGRAGGPLALAGLLALAVFWLATPFIGAISAGTAAWLAGASVLAGMLLRLVLGRLYPQPGWSSLGEAGRWLIILAVAIWFVRPYYTHRPIGAGDAYWYDMMLSDFVTQVRAGQFPVWAGVTEYAFNGAVSPFRLAPWFQHFGALLDLLTARSLDLLSLKNLLISVNMGLTGFSAYFFLRALLPRQPLLACAAAVAFLASPAVLTPLLGGDQYMTFVALPFLPAVCFGLWRVAQTNDVAGHLALAAGISGLWLAHPPIAFWTTCLAALAYAVKLVAFRGERVLPFTVLGVAAFLVLGSLPVISVLSLENTLYTETSGAQAAAEVAAAFPNIFLPLGKIVGTASDNQPGYALLYVLLWALAWFRRGRGAGAMLLALGVAAYPVLFLPVPLVTATFWKAMPSAVMEMTNNWPMQRLVPIWSFFVIFLFAAVHRQPETTPASPWRGRLFLLGLLPLLAWSDRQANVLIHRAAARIPRDPQSHLLYQRHNLLLSRYPFTSFASVPAYFSHGYMDPRLEHRLLRKDGTPLASNIESAARKGALPIADLRNTDLLAHGTLRAVNEHKTEFYTLTPELALPANEPLVLWLESLGPPHAGHLQIRGQDIFREYILPDSGQVSNRAGVSRAFGTLPGSPGIISLFTSHPGGEKPLLTVILPQRPIDEGFDFARYELWRYDPARLPVAIKSWIPYHLTVNSPEPGYLETPRLWLGGYRAEINGRPVPVERSPGNLAMFPVPAGTSEVTVRFVPPPLLGVVYWLCLAGWTVLLPAALFWLWRRTGAATGPADAAG